LFFGGYADWPPAGKIFFKFSELIFR